MTRAATTEAVRQACALVEAEGTWGTQRGAAYLVRPQWAVTCAHVVHGVPIGTRVQLHFPAQTLQAAVRHMDTIRDVVLIESPIPTGWRGHTLTFAQLTGFAYKSGPAPIAARRRDSWPSRAAAREFFAGKTFVKAWADGVLDDFIEHADALRRCEKPHRVVRYDSRSIQLAAV